MGSVRRGGVIEKVANVFCGNSNNSANSLGSRNAKVEKGGPPEKSGRFLLGKVRSSNGLTCSSSTPHTSPRPTRRTPRLQRKPLTWDELIKDENFLSRLFQYLSGSERAVAAQVCLRWRTVLYQPSYWRTTRAVLHCKEVRADTEEQTVEMRRKFYVSVQMRGFDSLVLVCATDSDLMDLVANYAVNHTRALRCVALRCCSVSDKGLEALLEHLGGVYQLELQSCNELTEAGLWAILHPRIVSLAVADCINVADEAIGAVAQLLPSLYELSLQAYHVTDAALALFSPRQTASLSILRLHSCWELTNQAVVNIGESCACAMRIFSILDVTDIIALAIGQVGVLMKNLSVLY
ncbi:hypothetical protein HAZT_HAZT011105 [Hyalella azteca]|uniref:F-box domain-containing protein n=1 Tax=Hyalella azteca TaxID=294128 RepID=A0A6A0H3C6_HYAAZ|nr:hypothetical protein HAZT_HAZT011105 [Hyalella azteca]